MEVGQLGRAGKIAMPRVTLAGEFVSVTAIILDLRTMDRIVERTTANIKPAPSTAVVGYGFLPVSYVGLKLTKTIALTHCDLTFLTMRFA